MPEDQSNDGCDCRTRQPETTVHSNEQFSIRSLDDSPGCQEQTKHEHHGRRHNDSGQMNVRIELRCDHKTEKQVGRQNELCTGSVHLHLNGSDKNRVSTAICEDRKMSQRNENRLARTLALPSRNSALSPRPSPMVPSCRFMVVIADGTRQNHSQPCHI